MNYINENEQININDKSNSTMQDIVYSHSSWGLLQISRISGSGSQSLFGSSIKHSNTIALRIYKAKKHRSLSRDWYINEGCPYIKIEMSPAQWAEAITSLNIGCGVPCTITQKDGQLIKFAEEITKIEEHAKEFENILNDVNKKNC